MPDKNKKNKPESGQPDPCGEWMHAYRVWYKSYVDTGGNPTNPPPPPPPIEEEANEG